MLRRLRSHDWASLMPCWCLSGTTLATNRRPSGARGVWIVFVLLLTVSCSSDSPVSDEAYSGAVAEVIEAMSELVPSWADDVAEFTNSRLVSSGKFDYSSQEAFAEREGGPIAEAACAAIDANQAVGGTEELNLLQAAEPLVEFVEIRLIQALGRFPLVLHTLQVRWPSTWLLSSSPAPSLGPYDPQFLKSLLRPEFVSDDGSLILPEVGTSEYDRFRAWTDDADNFLSETAGALVMSIGSEITDCIIRARAK